MNVAAIKQAEEYVQQTVKHTQLTILLSFNTQHIYALKAKLSCSTHTQVNNLSGKYDSITRHTIYLHI